ncbi:peripheral plasma membrane protein CASK-like isoform X2 [Symsagittifera roscoffensis]|uniref:peripheral plasma membrane protein CASK-like isoform X2 n=1 Tax=Symsagittifera roscoffensis TaxID=84072 RepID=UPI00307B9183
MRADVNKAAVSAPRSPNYTPNGPAKKPAPVKSAATPQSNLQNGNRYTNGVTAMHKQPPVKPGVNRNNKPPVEVSRKALNDGERVDTTVAMVGGEKKFGFSIAGGANRSHFPKVDNIHPESAASRANLKLGDEIIAINGVSIEHATHEGIITTIHKSSHNRSVSLTVIREPPPPEPERPPTAVKRSESTNFPKAVVVHDSISENSDESSSDEEESDEEYSDEDDARDGRHPNQDELSEASTLTPNENEVNGYHEDDEGNELEISEEHSPNGNGFYKKAEKVDEDVTSNISSSEINSDPENIYAARENLNVHQLKEKFEPNESPRKQNRHFYSMNEPEIRKQRFQKKNDSIFMKTDSFKQYEKDENNVKSRYNLDDRFGKNDRDYDSEKYTDSLEENSINQGEDDLGLDFQMPEREDPIGYEQRKRLDTIPYKATNAIEITVDPPSELTESEPKKTSGQVIDEEPLLVEKRSKAVESGIGDLESFADGEKKEKEPKLDLVILHNSLHELDDVDALRILTTLQEDRKITNSIRRYLDTTQQSHGQLNQHAHRNPERLDSRAALPSVSNVFVNGTYSDIPSRSSTPLDTEVIVNTPYEDRGSDDASWAEISDPGLRDVFVTKPAGQHIGVTVKNSEDGRVIIARIVKGGNVETKDIHVGDELLSVNDMSADGLTADDVSDMINAVSGQVKLKVRTSPDTRSYHNRALEVSHDDNDGGEMNGHDSADFRVRAQFNFDPDRESRCPCPELALTFTKRDILHVCAVREGDDPFWWQAFKDNGKGHHDSSMAGIIPSKKFIEQKDENRKLASANSVYVPKKKKGLKYLCGGGRNKKKKEKQVNSHGRKGGTTDAPSYYNSSPNVPRILSYEEITRVPPDRFYPETRPLVLISALVGDAVALQKRLCEQFPESTIQPQLHTTRPYEHPSSAKATSYNQNHRVSSQTLNSIPSYMRTSSYQTANQNHNNNFNSTPETEPEWFHVGVNHFQEMERSSKFISVQSVGDYMYGLSVESVVEAMQSSNTCVFVCPPESIYKIRNAIVKPYTVFLSAPNREILKDNCTNNRGCFMKAKEINRVFSYSVQISDRYLHLMDHVIPLTSQDTAYDQLQTTLNKLQSQHMYCPTSWLENF